MFGRLLARFFSAEGDRLARLMVDWNLGSLLAVWRLLLLLWRVAGNLFVDSVVTGTRLLLKGTFFLLLPTAKTGLLLPPITAETGLLLPPITAETGLLLPPITAETDLLLPPITAATGLLFVAKPKIVVFFLEFVATAEGSRVLAAAVVVVVGAGAAVVLLLTVLRAGAAAGVAERDRRGVATERERRGVPVRDGPRGKGDGWQ